jgi:predicted transcriptional regulator
MRAEVASVAKRGSSVTGALDKPNRKALVSGLEQAVRNKSKITVVLTSKLFQKHALTEAPDSFIFIYLIGNSDMCHCERSEAISAIWKQQLRRLLRHFVSRNDIILT